jgi:hypothetical protein
LKHSHQARYINLIICEVETETFHIKRTRVLSVSKSEANTPIVGYVPCSNRCGVCTKCKKWTWIGKVVSISLHIWPLKQLEEFRLNVFLDDHTKRCRNNLIFSLYRSNMKEPELLSRYSDEAMIWNAEESGFDSRQEQEIFLFSIMFRPALGPTQPPIQWISGALSPGVERLGREPDHSPPSCAEVKDGGAITLFLNASSWSALIN